MKSPEQADERADKEISLGIVSELGKLGSGAVISEQALARIFHRHPVSIKRAVARGELPPPTRLLGGPVWTVGALIRHIEERLAKAQREQEKLARKVEELSP
jgi:hypothetical protein